MENEQLRDEIARTLIREILIGSVEGLRRAGLGDLLRGDLAAHTDLYVEKIAPTIATALDGYARKMKADVEDRLSTIEGCAAGRLEHIERLEREINRLNAQLTAAQIAAGQIRSSPADIS